MRHLLYPQWVDTMRCTPIKFCMKFLHSQISLRLTLTQLSHPCHSTIPSYHHLRQPTTFFAFKSFDIKPQVGGFSTLCQFSWSPSCLHSPAKLIASLLHYGNFPLAKAFSLVFDEVRDLPRFRLYFVFPIFHDITVSLDEELVSAIHSGDP